MLLNYIFVTVISQEKNRNGRPNLSLSLAIKQLPKSNIYILNRSFTIKFKISLNN